MPTLARTRAAVVIVAASAFTGVSCGDDKPTSPVPQVNTVRVEWERRRSVALAEIATLGPEHPWAGDYQFPGDVGQRKRLILAPNSGCVAQSFTCIASVPHLGEDGRLNLGSVVEANGVLHVTFERPNDPTAHFGFHTEYTVHGTGSDRYLREVPLPGKAWGRIFERAGPSAQTIVRAER